MYLFLPIYQICLLGMNLQRCFSMHAPKENSSLLPKIREPVWSYIIDRCTLFVARDCNACFSQILEERTFGHLNEEEESLFTTLRAFDFFCYPRAFFQFEILWHHSPTSLVKKPQRG